MTPRLKSEPTVMFRTVRALARLARAAPFKHVGAGSDLKLYVAFLARRPRKHRRFPLTSRQEALDLIGMKGLEVFIVSRRKKSGWYGFPNNVVEAELGVLATTRNWSTVTKIVALATPAPSRADSAPGPRPGAR